LKKPIVILLLVCFLLQAGGLWLLMYCRQMTLKREMKTMLRSYPNRFGQIVLEFELVKGKPVAPSFEWEGEDEFRYNRSIYDVVEKKVTGNTLQVRCIDDKKEADIMNKIEDLGKKEQDDKKSRPACLHQLLSLLLFYQQNCYEPVTFFSSLLHIDDYRAFFNHITIDIIAPPPRQPGLFNC
jgi:hypothetical protein